MHGQKFSVQDYTRVQAIKALAETVCISVSIIKGPSRAFLSAVYRHLSTVALF
jgi:hypothetical protein